MIEIGVRNNVLAKLSYKNMKDYCKSVELVLEKVSMVESTMPIKFSKFVICFHFHFITNKKTMPILLESKVVGKID